MQFEERKIAITYCKFVNALSPFGMPPDRALLYSKRFLFRVVVNAPPHSRTAHVRG